MLERRSGSHGKAPEVRIGTSGWHYGGWWGPFYPQEISKADSLVYYASQFDAVELNAPFYRTPTANAVRRWFEVTPDDFRFAWKASQFITHRKRLLVDDRSLDMLESGLDHLGHKLGPVLFQLPPTMKVDRERLAGFLARLDPARRYTVEFRHPSWYDPAIFDLLEEHNVALCLSDHDAAPAPREVSADWVYIRNHGSSGHYHGNYSDDALRGWASFIRKCSGDGRDVWCFFDNDVKSAAPADARKLSVFVQEAKVAG